MLLTGSVVRALIATAYILTITASTALTFFFYSEPVLFAFVITAVALLVMSYPILCIITVTHSYDLQIKGCCRFEWIPIAVDLVESASVKSVDEKPTKFDEAFAYAYISPVVFAPLVSQIVARFPNEEILRMDDRATSMLLSTIVDGAFNDTFEVKDKVDEQLRKIAQFSLECLHTGRRYRETESEVPRDHHGRSKAHFHGF